MANTGRKLAIALTVASVVVAAARTGAAADLTSVPATESSESHLRSSSPALLALMQQASERSATFRRLVETIQTSDSYVYVDKGNCRHGVRACFVSVTTAGPRRLMFVMVDTRKPDWDLMGSIGHELRHTIEVINVPSIRSYQDKYYFYERIGQRATGGTRETEAALDAGDDVRSEVRRFTGR